MGELWVNPIDGLTEDENAKFYAAYGEHVDAILAEYGITMLGDGEFIDAVGLPHDYEELDELSNFDFDWTTL